MDDWIDDAVDDAMFDAGPEALKSLKAARKLWADYRKQFFGKKGADKFIAKMAEDEASPRDVFAWLYSNGRMGGNRQSTEYAAKLKDVLGEGSEEWAAIRQGAWAKLTQANAGGAKPGYQKTGSALVEFLTGETRSLARTLFSPDEIKEMFVFARAMKTLTPQKAATNPSGSGYEARRLAETAMRRLGEMLGFAAGGLEGALAGGAAARGAAGGGGWLKARVATGGARPSRNVVPGVVGGNLAVGQGRENYGVRPLVR